MALVERREYLQRALSLRDKGVIKAIAGIRRCGKSVLLRQIQDRLVASGVDPAAIVSVNLELLENEHLRDRRALHKHVLSNLAPSGTTYLFIDEVQRCQGFEDAVESLYARGGIDIYLTGSNASMLSGELATLLAGRYVAIEMLPLSFPEFLELLKERGIAEPNVLEAFAQYLRWGSLPQIAELYPLDELRSAYLEGVYSTVVVKDVVARHGIRDASALRRIARYLAENVGSPVSGRKIAGALTSSGHKVSQPTVENYIDLLADARLFYRVGQLDVRGKETLEMRGKYYCADSGLRGYMTGFRPGNRGHVLENVVFLELVRRGWKVSTGRVGDLEIDFVAERAGETRYIQVSETVASEETLARELAPLQKAAGWHPRMLLTMDYDLVGSYDGIVAQNVVGWLLGNDPAEPVGWAGL